MKIEDIKKVMVAGGGTLGSQIAWQTAFHGFEVRVYDAFAEGIEKSKNFHKAFADIFLNQRGATQEQIDATFARISYYTDLAEAVQDVDLISESVPENIEIKKEFYKQLAKVAPEKTIFTTNSSTTLPSYYAEETGRPEKFCALHFANGIWDANVGEVMGHPGTAPETFDLVVEFAKAIGMVPIPIKKEQPGYVLNSLLVPWLHAATELIVNEVSDPHSIDKTWMISTGAPVGPFAILDKIGMTTAYNVNLLSLSMGDESAQKRADFFKKMIDEGKIGVETGEGFYKYPNPAYADPEFLK
jgi:3-hydroxybutyryl-CoA dehydrogenase